MSDRIPSHEWRIGSIYKYSGYLLAEAVRQHRTSIVSASFIVEVSDLMASETIPKVMKAFVTQGKGSAGVQDVPVPSIDANEILVLNVAVAQNPTDWKCKLWHTLRRCDSQTAHTLQSK